MEILTTRGSRRVNWETLMKPLKFLNNFCHRCQKPEGGVVLGIDTLILIYVPYIYFNLCIFYDDSGLKGIIYVCIIVFDDVRMGSCYECLAVRQV